MPFDGNNNEALEVMQKLKARLDRPEKWCKNMGWDGPRACLRGALYNVLEGVHGPSTYWIKAQHEALPSRIEAAMDAEARARGYTSPSWQRGISHIEFNNDRKTKHADIVNFLDAVERRLTVGGNDAI